MGWGGGAGAAAPPPRRPRPPPPLPASARPPAALPSEARRRGAGWHGAAAAAGGRAAPGRAGLVPVGPRAARGGGGGGGGGGRGRGVRPAAAAVGQRACEGSGSAAGRGSALRGLRPRGCPGPLRRRAPARLGLTFFLSFPLPGRCVCQGGPGPRGSRAGRLRGRLPPAVLGFEEKFGERGPGRGVAELGGGSKVGPIDSGAGRRRADGAVEDGSGG